MMADDLLKKWLNDELTGAEKEAFSKQSDYAINRNIIDKAQYFKASEFSKVDSFETFRKAYQNKPSEKRITWIKPLLRVAAVLLISFSLYFTVFNKNTIEEQTLLSEKTTLSLPDLSQVTLNADSKITYDANNWDSKRSLNLEGEAYFKVAKGKTFDVHTNNGVVTVVGTEFNVKARKNYFEVVCYEGIVKVVSGTVIRQLTAGQTYRILNNTFSEDTIRDIVPQWTINKSRFKRIPIAEVIEELERQYNIKVDFSNVDTTRLFSGGFVHNNLENALISITKPMNLAFEISSSNQVLINGKTN
ncbi:FecR family protein [Winogradskyella sp. PG-2]|uniref:FecR family protein n=1 Tax=Winogradskyella sp. PG-2 TaxID=754409 RepID=UPI0004588B87|nr:FecR family protein [Winogradskyella sp. PG-2]BAO75746.1 putative anti-sigma factor [Winogradskyella sp. PG-2]